MRLRARVDGNQKLIVEALRKAGCSVWCCHQLGHGFPDLLVRTRRRTLKQIEVKQPGETLTEDEAVYMAMFPETVIVRSVEEAFKACGITVTEIRA